MIQLVTQYAGFGLFAQIALALFFLAFMMILVSTLIRPRSQMQHYARMALSDAPGVTPTPGVTPAPGGADPKVSPGGTPTPGVTPAPGGADPKASPGGAPGSAHDPSPQANAEHGAAHHE